MTWFHFCGPEKKKKFFLQNKDSENVRSTQDTAGEIQENDSNSEESVYDSADDEFDGDGDDSKPLDDKCSDEILKKIEEDSGSYDDGEDEDSDEGGWITPGNIKDVKTNFDQDIVEDPETTVIACLTTDFAMQVSIWFAAHCLRDVR